MKTQFNNLSIYLPSYFSLREVVDGKSLPAISLEESDSYYEKEGYPQIGKATLVVEFFSEKQITGKQVQALKAQLAAMRAKHQREQNALLDRISKLQALTFEGSAT